MRRTEPRRSDVAASPSGSARLGEGVGAHRSPAPSSLHSEEFETRFEFWFPRVAGWLHSHLPPETLEDAICEVFTSGMDVFDPSSPLDERKRAALLLRLAREAAARRSAGSAE